MDHFDPEAAAPAAGFTEEELADQARHDESVWQREFPTLIDDVFDVFDEADGPTDITDSDMIERYGREDAENGLLPNWDGLNRMLHDLDAYWQGYESVHQAEYGH